MPFCLVGANHALAILHGKASSFTPPSVYYAGLFLADPTFAGLLTSEVSNADYARVALTSLLSSPSNGYINNATDIKFNVASTTWGGIGWIGVLDTSTLGQGKMVHYIALPSVVSILSGDTFILTASHYNNHAV